MKRAPAAIRAGLRGVGALALLVALAAPGLAFAEAEGFGPRAWWHGPGLTAPQAGPNRFLRERGIRFGGHYYGALFGILESRSGTASPWDEGAQLDLDLEADRLLRAPSLAGLVLTVEGRWRAEPVAADPNSAIGGNSMFDPSNWASGTGWRLLQINATYTSSLGSSVADRLWLRLGWVQPRYEFALQPMTDRILNNAVNSAKGIGGNIPFSSSFSTWGGMARWRSPELYVKAGVFMAYPDATASSNHGVQFGGNPPRNGAMAMAEVGFTPSLAGPRLASSHRPWPSAEHFPAPRDARSLPGKYVLGAYLYDNANGRTTADGSANFGLQSGLYVQADQLLLHEPGSRAAAGDEPQGLTGFSLLAVAPARNSQFQLYLHTGLGYTGVVPGRDRDALVAVVAYGNYARSTHDETSFVEAGYHAAVNGWLDLYPFVQASIRPAGDASVPNAVVLGFATNVVF